MYKLTCMVEIILFFLVEISSFFSSFNDTLLILFFYYIILVISNHSLYVALNYFFVHNAEIKYLNCYSLGINNSLDYYTYKNHTYHLFIYTHSVLTCYLYSYTHYSHTRSIIPYCHVKNRNISYIYIINHNFFQASKFMSNITKYNFKAALLSSTSFPIKLSSNG